MSAGAWKNLAFFGVIFGAMIGLTTWFGRPAPMPDAFAEDTRLVSALEQSKQSGKPVFALVTADWCGGCQRYKRGSLSESDVAAELLDRTIPVYVDLEHNPDDVALIGSIGLAVRYLPTTVVIRDGQIVSAVEGPQSAAEIRALIETGEQEEG